MRSFVMFLFLAISVPCYAEDPLETLNTIAETLSTMEQTLKLRTVHRSAGMLAKAGVNSERLPFTGMPTGAGVTSERLPFDDRLYFTSDEAPGPNSWVAVRPCTDEVAFAQAASDAQSCVWQPDGTVAMGAHFWKSRPAVPEDLRVGAVVVVQDQSGDGGWFLAKITGLSELNSGYLATSAPLRASVKGLRVVE